MRFAVPNWPHACGANPRGAGLPGQGWQLRTLVFLSDRSFKGLLVSDTCRMPETKGSVLSGCCSAGTRGPQCVAYPPLNRTLRGTAVSPSGVFTLPTLSGSFQFEEADVQRPLERSVRHRLRATSADFHETLKCHQNFFRASCAALFSASSFRYSDESKVMAPASTVSTIEMS